ncbi:ribonuclease R, partial [candidate division KSB1 bacterium]
LENDVLFLLEKYSGVAFKSKEIQRRLKIPSRNYPELKRCLKKLLEEKRIERAKNRRYRFASHNILSGVFRSSKYGYGFVSTEKGEIYIGKENRGTAFPGDKVRVEIFARKSGKSREGRIVEVIEKRKREIVGTYRKLKINGYVIPDDMKYVHNVYVNDSNAKNVKDGQKVVVRIDRWESEFLNPEGSVVEVIGYPGEKGVDIFAIARSYGFASSFPEEVVKEAEKMDEKMILKEIENRVDFRNKLIFTIDPEDAKDFDDAISLEEKGDGKFQLGVHIADVSFFVRDSTELDKEARKRGTSIYLIDRVIPMLPENLSNNLCSLIPGRDRLTFSIIIDLSRSGDVLNYKILKTVINSKKRFSYREAQEILDGKKESEFYPVLKKMNELARVLRNKREEKGSIDFDVPEVSFELNEKDVPVKIYKRELFDTNYLIEEFMLQANCIAASHILLFERKYQVSLPYIYRVHDKPNRDDIKDFTHLIKVLGYNISRKGKKEVKWFQEVLSKCIGKPEENLVKEVALRSMRKAVYSPKNIGHFALAFERYTHFTSPIRRYPDLILHRLMKKYDEENFSRNDMKILKKELKDVCEHSSEMEQLSEEAEREVIRLKQLEYMKQHIGEVFSAVISGVTSFGLFVETRDSLCEGLIHIRNLEDDFYEYDEKNYALKGKSREKIYRLGDPIQVLLVRVDEEEKHIDFIPY